ncbi:MAG: TonB-dependent receptor [Sulfurimonas sp.]|jgi:iron complex outermembrane receptor protein
MKKKIVLSLFISSVLVAQSVELEPLSIVSTAIKTDELKSTDAVEIYTAEDIQKAHVQNIYEFLNQQTSVTAMPSYGNSYSQKIDFRGYGMDNGYQNILITINGRKINNVDMVPQLLLGISPASIERLEIIKSSGIVKGGDGANAGAINIITKKSNAKEITVYGGTHGTADGSFYLGHSEEKFSINASGEAQRSDGSRYINSSGDKDESSMRTASLNVAYNPIDTVELRAGASFARTDITYASFLTLDEYNNDAKQAGAFNWGSANQKYDTDALNLGFSYHFNDKLSLDIDANKEKKRSNYVTYASVSDYTYDSAKATLTYEDKNFVLLGGIEGFQGERESASDVTSKDNIAAFIIGNMTFDSHSIKAGYRAEKIKYSHESALLSLKDDYSLSGIELGYNYTLDSESSVFANYAYAYQAPDIDRFFKKDWLGNVSFNEFIKPMKTDNFTVGFNHILPTNKLKISLYYISLKDEIYLNPLTWANTNIDKSYKYGLDIYDKWLITDEFNIALNYNYVKAIIDEEGNYSGNKLPGVSDHNIKATLAYSLSKSTSLALTQTYRSSAYALNDFNNNFTQKQDAYKSTDISISYTKESLELFAKINNLFNQKNALWVEDDAIYPMNFCTTAIAGFKLKI